jgi:hypothetical protein
MCEEILPNLFQIKTPLPESPLKYLNCYVVRNSQKNLIIDTGLNRRECLEAMQMGLKKLEEILAILNKHPMHAFQIASRMTWDIEAENWDHFPVAQRWFATGEAIAHLRYLEEEKKVIRENKDGLMFYSLNMQMGTDSAQSPFLGQKKRPAIKLTS